MAKEMIYKIQVPMMTNEPIPMAMVYTRGRKNRRLITINDSIREFMGGDLKKFAYGWYDEVLDQFNITKDAPFQDW